MIPSFPGWLWAWVALLPAVAGSTNAVALLALRHGGVTHLTGVSTEGAIGMGTGDLVLVWHAFAVVSLFTLGCAISAWIARGPRWTPYGRTGSLLLAVAALLGAAYQIFGESPSLGIFVCALAIGIQNGVTSVATGAVLRTSHLTGMFTDIGIALGQISWNGPVDYRRVSICTAVIASFGVGATAGAFLYTKWHARALLVSAAIAATASLLTFVFRAKGRQLERIGMGKTS